MQSVYDPFTAYMEEQLPDLQDALEAHNDIFIQGEHDAYGAIWWIHWCACPPLDSELWACDVEAWKASRQAWAQEHHDAHDDLLLWADTPPAELEQEILAFLDAHGLVLSCETLLILPGEQERDDARDLWIDTNSNADGDWYEGSDDRTYDEWRADYQADHQEIDWDAIEAFHERYW